MTPPSIFLSLLLSEWADEQWSTYAKLLFKYKKKKKEKLQLLSS